MSPEYSGMFSGVVLCALVALSGVSASPTSPASKWWSHMAAPLSIPISVKVQDVPVSYTTPMIIARYGYPSETHTIQTADGYILSMHRIPNPGKPAIYLQHGILSSSADWVVLGPKKALGFLLHDAGYDVWMGNFRGNTYSRAHATLSPSNYKFWDFSWHEMGMHDIPTMIDHILKETKQKSLVYVGHSQGTTAFMVMASLKPEYNDKVKAFIAMAPVAFLKHVASLPLQIISKGVSEIAFITKVLGVGEFLPSSEFMSSVTSKICADGSIFQGLCTNVLFVITGFDYEEFDTGMLPDILKNVPAGASTKQLIHFGQLINIDKFQQFDYGMVKNLFKYGSLWPPQYPLNKITTRVYLHYADNDLIAVPQGVNKIKDAISNVKLVRKVPNESYNHMDFLYGKDNMPLLYQQVLDSIQEVFEDEE